MREDQRLSQVTATTRKRSAIVAVSMLLWAMSAGAQNLLVNPTFDTDLSGWARSAFEGFWDPNDANGSPLSGSVRGDHEGAPSGGAFQTSNCVNVLAGKDYDLKAAFLYPDTAVSGQVTANVRWYSEVNCQGVIGVSSRIALKNDESSGEWEARSITFAAPPGAVSGKIELTVQKNAAGSIEVFADNVEFCVTGTCEPTVDTSACQVDSESACLLSGRFEVTVEWTTPSSTTGVGQVMQFNSQRAENDQSAFFWFFAPDNFEMGVKMVDACIDPFNRFWVFVSGLTDVGFVVQVRDTVTGKVNAYTNPVGLLPLTVGDTDAFPCD